MTGESKWSAARTLRKLLTYWAIFATNLDAFVIGLVFVTALQSPLRDIGTSLVASGIVGWFSLYVVKVQENRREGIQRLSDWGLVDVYEDRSQRKIYEKYLAKCHERLDIQAESLTRFYSDFKDLLHVINQKGAKIRLLILDPESEQCKMRVKEEDAPERLDLASIIKLQTRKFLQMGLENMQVRWYSCTPSVNYFRVDDHTFFGSYFVGLVSRNSLTFLGRASGRVTEPYSTHFERVWKDFSREVPSSLDSS